jgi:nitroreductase
MRPIYGAPTLIVVSSKKDAGAEKVGIADAACIVENMHLAATDLGLGSVYLWAFLRAFVEDSNLLTELNLPAGFQPVSGLAVGYPTEPLIVARELKKTIAINTID